MTEDARFEDGAERPLRLRAESAEDLAVISALMQDAVVQTSDIAWARRRHRFGTSAPRPSTVSQRDRASAAAPSTGTTRSLSPLPTTRRKPSWRSRSRRDIPTSSEMRTPVP